MFKIYTDSMSSIHTIPNSHENVEIGFIQLVSTEIDQEPAIQIMNFCVYKPYRNKGYGKYILGFTLEMIKNVKYCMLDDMTDRSNHVYGNIYQQFGFEFEVTPTVMFTEKGILKWKIAGPERIKKMN